MLLVSRVVAGIVRIQEASTSVQTFGKACRSVAVLSSFVTETLTGSAGAEVEKGAITKFRFELVRLLNLAFNHYVQMLQGNKLAVPPSSLRAADHKAEAEILSAVGNPTVMVCKLLASLLEQQRAAKRISNEAVGVVMGKVTEMIDAHQATLSISLAPAPVALSSFTFFFTAVWAYSVGPVLALSQIEEQTAPGMGLMLTVLYSLFLNLFFFGLYEAGNIVEEPLKVVQELVSTAEMAHDISDDLSSLVGGDVPNFLPKPDEN
jgi:hypothetical protein